MVHQRDPAVVHRKIRIIFWFARDEFNLSKAKSVNTVPSTSAVLRLLSTVPPAAATLSAEATIQQGALSLFLSRVLLCLANRCNCNKALVERLYGHIDGTIPAPPKYIDREVKRTVVANQGAGTSAGSEIRFEYETVTENNPAYEVWLAHDQSLVAYITSTLSEEVLGGVDDDLTALELWSTLATTYSQVSEARFLQLRRQFQDIKRGTRTVLEYLNEIKSVSDQLAIIGHPVSDKDKVQQALSGLRTKFDIFCTALEVLPVLPSFEDLKAKLFQHEASRVQRQNLIPSNSHNVLIIGTHALQGNRTCPWTPQAGMGRGILPTPPGTNTTSSTPRRVPTCFYCNKRGHVKSECWHNPQNKNNHIRREGKAAAGAASSSSGQNVTSNVPADVQQLLMTALSKLQLKQNEQGEWYVDSGAAAHVTGDTGMLPEQKEQKEQAVNEPETLGNTSLDSTASLDNMPSSSQQNDPPRDNRFSGLVYSRRSVPTIAQQRESSPPQRVVAAAHSSARRRPYHPPFDHPPVVALLLPVCRHPLVRPSSPFCRLSPFCRPSPVLSAASVYLCLPSSAAYHRSSSSTTAHRRLPQCRLCILRHPLASASCVSVSYRQRRLVDLDQHRCWSFSSYRRLTVATCGCSAR
ncbi:Retrovirus-related Pol polyprotein from transposon TNT 1-94 [Nymphaea thermarum]|nr:Retrovirus-related Pol polyprotein from transposon TNT 1-94 [Nymphaea thermarum]